MNDLAVLSFGFTRALWEGEEAEDFQRMMAYAEQLREYVVVVNSYKHHRLERRQLAPHVEAIPTDARGKLHSLARMFAIGWSVLRSRKIDLIQAQDPLVTGSIAVLLGKIFRRPVNVCIYGPNVHDPNWLASHWTHRASAPVSRWVMRNAAGLQVDGQLTARRLIEAGYSAERVAVKPLVPMNLERFIAIERVASTTRNVGRLLFVGRLASQKNLLLLIEIAKLLRARGLSFELRLVGDGPRAEELRDAVSRAGLNDVVQFRGVASRDETVREFAEADVFVLSSDYEGFPRVLMEAAAAALPIVTTAVSGADEAVIDGQTGYIVPVRAAELAAEKIAELIEEPALRLRMGAAAREHIRTKLDPATNAPIQVAIWRRLAPTTLPNESSASSQPNHLLLFNLVTDAQHPILGFTSQWIRELATRVETIDVITMCGGEVDLPANVRVHSVGRERGYSEPRRVLRFYRLLFRILKSRQIDGCFSHMAPEFSALAGPILGLWRVPLVTWYAHPKLTRWVKLAHFFSDRMVTSLPAAYPYRRDKLSVIGQGIDTSLFAPLADANPSDELVLCVGRISRVKNHATLLRAIPQLSHKVRLVIRGATAGADDEEYARELRALVAELRLENIVTFAPPVRSSELPAVYRECAVHVNLTPAGFGDKVAWESMSCGRPCLVANEDFRETLGEHTNELLFRDGDVADLARKLDQLLAKTAAERAAIGAHLRANVERLHSLPRLADQILNELRRSRRTQPSKHRLVPAEVACAR